MIVALDIAPDEVRRRFIRTIPASWEADQRRAYMIGLMVGARAPEFGPLLETWAGAANDSPPEKLEQAIRVFADILITGNVDG